MNSRRTSNQANSQKKVYQNKNLQITFAVSLMAVLGVSSITPAFPKIAQALNVSPQSVGFDHSIHIA